MLTLLLHDRAEKLFYWNRYVQDQGSRAVGVRRRVAAFKVRHGPGADADKSADSKAARDIVHRSFHNQLMSTLTEPALNASHGDVAGRYAQIRDTTRVHERALFAMPRIPSEVELQARWFAGDFGREFVSTNDDRIDIVQFGVWNRQAGPDYRDAAIRINGANQFTVASKSICSIAAGNHMVTRRIQRSRRPCFTCSWRGVTVRFSRAHSPTGMCLRSAST